MQCVIFFSRPLPHTHTETFPVPFWSFYFPASNAVKLTCSSTPWTCNSAPRRSLWCVHLLPGIPFQVCSAPIPQVFINLYICLKPLRCVHLFPEGIFLVCSAAEGFFRCVHLQRAVTWSIFRCAQMLTGVSHSGVYRCYLESFWCVKLFSAGAEDLFGGVGVSKCFSGLFSCIVPLLEVSKALSGFFRCVHLLPGVSRMCSTVTWGLSDVLFDCFLESLCVLLSPTVFQLLTGISSSVLSC